MYSNLKKAFYERFLPKHGKKYKRSKIFFENALVVFLVFFVGLLFLLLPIEAGLALNESHPLLQIVGSRSSANFHRCAVAIGDVLLLVFQDVLVLAIIFEFGLRLELDLEWERPCDAVADPSFAHIAKNHHVTKISSFDLCATTTTTTQNPNALGHGVHRARRKGKVVCKGSWWQNEVGGAMAHMSHRPIYLSQGGQQPRHQSDNSNSDAIQNPYQDKGASLQAGRSTINLFENGLQVGGFWSDIPQQQVNVNDSFIEKSNQEQLDRDEKDYVFVDMKEYEL